MKVNDIRFKINKKSFFWNEEGIQIINKGEKRLRIEMTHSEVAILTRVNFELSAPILKVLSVNVCDMDLAKEDIKVLEKARVMDIFRLIQKSEKKLLSLGVSPKSVEYIKSYIKNRSLRLATTFGPFIAKKIASDLTRYNLMQVLEPRKKR